MKLSVGAGGCAPGSESGNRDQVDPVAHQAARDTLVPAGRRMPAHTARLLRNGSSAASAVMCLSIVCLGAGLAKAAREPGELLRDKPKYATSGRIPISAFAEMAEAGDVAQVQSDDAIVPPVKRQRPVTPSIAPEAPPSSAPAQEQAPADANAQSAPAASSPDPATPVPATQSAQEKPPAGPPAAAGGPQVEETPAMADRSGPVFPEMGGIFAPITDWLARANREYQGTIVKELSRPSEGAAPSASEQAAKDDAQAKEAEAAREREAATSAEQQAKAAAEAQAARAAAEAAAAAAASGDQQKSAEQKDLQADVKAREAEAARLAQEARKQADARRSREEEEARKLRDAARLAEERRQKHAAEDLAKKEQAEREAAAAREARLAAEQRGAEAEAEQTASRARVANQSEPETGDRHLKHRRWAITITPEPIPRPRAGSAVPRQQVRYDQAETERGVLIGTRRLAPRMGLGAGAMRGSNVKGWSWRGSRCRFAGRRVKHLPGRYTVAHGDSLWRISEKHYDSGRHYKHIYRANRHKIADPNRIYPCQKFKVPRR